MESVTTSTSSSKHGRLQEGIPSIGSSPDSHRFRARAASIPKLFVKNLKIYSATNNPFKKQEFKFQALANVQRNQKTYTQNLKKLTFTPSPQFFSWFSILKRLCHEHFVHGNNPTRRITLVIQ